MNREIWSGWQRIWNDEPIAHVQATEGIELPESFDDINVDRMMRWMWQERPDLLSPCLSAPVEMSKRDSVALIDQLAELMAGPAQFRFLRRYLEVVDQGNRCGRWRIPLVYLPAPMPPAPKSPFSGEAMEAVVRLERVEAAYFESLDQWNPIGEKGVVIWGAVFWSAILCGGLLDTRTLSAVPESLIDAESGLRWLDLQIGSAQKGKNETSRPSDTRMIRWLPDPLSRLLLVRLVKSGRDLMQDLTELKGSQRARSIWRSMGAWASAADMPLHGFRDLTDVLSAARALWTTRIPSFLVDYAKGSMATTGLPSAQWQRLLTPRATYLRRMPRLPSRQEAHIRNFEIGQKGEGEEGDEDARVLLADLRSLIQRHTVSGNSKAAREDIQRWCAECGDALLPSVLRLAQWCCRWAFRGVRGRRALAPRTVRAMLSAFGGRLVAQLGRMDPVELGNANRFRELYHVILDDCNSADVRSRAASAVKSFHRWLEKEHGAPPLALLSITGRRPRGGGSADANLLCDQTFTNALDWLRKRVAEKHGARVSESVGWVMVLGYEAGLRRSEAVGIEVSDIRCDTEPESKEVWLDVLWKGGRRLKTQHAVRSVPLHLLMQPRRLTGFLAYVEKRRKAGEDAPLFVDGEGGALSPDDHVFDRVREALVRASHDPTLRYHHLRHSFANRVLLLFWLAEHPYLPPWLFPSPADRQRLENARQVRRALLGKSPTSRRMLYQIAQLVGHSGPDVTCNSYLHLMDLLHGMATRRVTPLLPVSTLSHLSGFSASHTQRLLRNNSADNEHAAERLESMSDGLLKEKPGDLASTAGADTPRLADPATPFEHLEQCAFVIQDGMGAYGKAAESSLFQEVPPSTKRQWMGRFEALCAAEGGARGGILRKTGLVPAPGEDWIEFPTGRREQAVAEQCAQRLSELLGGPGQKAQATQSQRRRFKEAIRRFPRQWIPGTAADMWLETVPQAKSLLELLEALGYPESIGITHWPSANGKHPDAQRKYWEAACKHPVRPARKAPPPGEVKGRGAVMIRMEKTVAGRKRRDPTAFGFRWVVALWSVGMD